MTAYLNKYRVARRFQCLAITILTMVSIPSQQANAQDLVLQNTTLNTTETITSSSAIVAGPDVTVESIGEVTFAANRVAVIPKFVVVQGGKLHVVAGGMPTGVETEGRKLSRAISSSIKTIRIPLIRPQKSAIPCRRLSMLKS